MCCIMHTLSIYAYNCLQRVLSTVFQYEQVAREGAYGLRAVFSSLSVV